MKEKSYYALMVIYNTKLMTKLISFHGQEGRDMKFHSISMYDMGQVLTLKHFDSETIEKFFHNDTNLKIIDRDRVSADMSREEFVELYEKSPTPLVFFRNRKLREHLHD